MNFTENILSFSLEQGAEGSNVSSLGVLPQRKRRSPEIRLSRFEKLYPLCATARAPPRFLCVGRVAGVGHGRVVGDFFAFLSIMGLLVRVPPPRRRGRVFWGSLSKMAGTQGGVV